MIPTATGTTIDHQTFTIAFERTFAAPPEDVFDAWTQPAHLTRWWDPTGAPLTSSDLRGGAAMIVAGLSAEGETEILDNGYINRGYDRFDACLSALGADVRCVAPR